MTDFATKFHNLQGDLIRERKKSFFKLLKETSLNSTQSDIDEAIKNLRPKSYQEKLFWVETLVYFKKTAPLIELLKEGNREYVKIIIRQKWFIEDAFKDMSASDLVDKFFPCVSYSTKLKLLRRIPNYWSEEKVDELFDAVQKRYGIYVVMDVLPACSAPKIKSILEENEILLHPYQVIHIFKKDEELFKTYIDYSFNLVKKPYDEECVLNVLAYENPALYLQLLKCNKIDNKVQLSKAPSAAIINIAKSEILADSFYYYGFLNTKAFASTLKADFVTFYRQICLKNACYNCMLKYLPKNKRWQIFYEAFKSNFPQKSMDELFKMIDSRTILLLNPGKEIVNAWAEFNYKVNNDEKFLQYCPTSLSIPILKEKINVTSDKEKRTTLLLLLVSTCAENKDMEALDEVMQYVGSRHKNEDGYTYRKIIESICKTFNKGELSKKHWDFVRQQAILIRLKGTVRFYDYRNIIDELLRYSYKNDKEMFKEVAQEFILDTVDAGYSFRTYLKLSDLDREIFEEFCKLMPETIFEDHRDFRTNLSSVLEEFYEISQLCPENCLNILKFPYLISAIEEAMNKDKLDDDDERIIRSAILYHMDFPQYSMEFLNETNITKFLSLMDAECISCYKEVLLKILNKESFSQTETTVLTFFLEKYDLDLVTYWMICYVVEALVLRHPKYLVKYFERLYSRILKCYDKKCIKHYTHLGLDKKIFNYLMKDWKCKSVDYRVQLMKIIQNLLPEEQFIEFVDEQFLPDKHLVDSLDKDANLKIQKCIAGLLKKANTAVNYLPLVLKYCKQDLLIYALPSLYSLFSRSPENMLHPYIEILSKQDICVRKHAVFLSCEFLDYNYVFNLLNSSDCSLNPSRKYLCLAALKYFIKNCSEELFSLIKKFLETINKNHKEIFSTLVGIKIPKKYRARYVEVCWKIFDNVDDDKIKVNKYFDKLLEQSFNEEVLKSVSPLFVKNVITRHLSVQGENHLTNIDKFAVLCLEYRSTERPNNFTPVFETLSKSNKKIISGFCKIFVDYMFNSQPDSKLIATFVENWNKYFSKIDLLDEYITLNLLLKYSNHPFDEYAETVVYFLDQLICEFGPQIFDIFKDNFEKCVKKMKKIDRFNLFCSMLNYKTAPSTVLVIQLLTPAIYGETEELKSVYYKIIQILESSEKDVVKCCYEIYLKKNGWVLDV